MAFSTPGNGRIKAEINVTPMIDVLLVLLIIFMVISPLVSEGLKAKVPQPAPASNAPDPGVVVITVHDGGGIDLNQESVASADVTSRLRGIFQTRGNITVFVRADDGLTFEPVVRVIDAAKGVGLEHVALMRR